VCARAAALHESLPGPETGFGEVGASKAKPSLKRHEFFPPHSIPPARLTLMPSPIPFLPLRKAGNLILPAPNARYNSRPVRIFDDPSSRRIGLQQLSSPI